MDNYSVVSDDPDGPDSIKSRARGSLFHREDKRNGGKKDSEYDVHRNRTA